MIIEDFYNYIVEMCEPFTDVQINGLTENQESISIFGTPGNPVMNRYLDGSVTGLFGTYILTQTKDKLTGYKWLIGLVDFFKEYKDIPLSDKLQFSAEPTTHVSLNGRSEDGRYIYIANFNIEYDEW